MCYRVRMSATVRKSKVQRLDWAQEARDNTWRQMAVCRDLDTSIFFPEGEGAELKVLYAKARRYCNECPVRQECLDYAMRVEVNEDSHRYGMYGGLTPSQRKRLRATQSGVHGAYGTYTRGCRCLRCREANREHSRMQRAKAS